MNWSNAGEMILRAVLEMKFTCSCPHIVRLKPTPTLMYREISSVSLIGVQCRSTISFKALRVFTGAAPKHTNLLSQLYVCVCVCFREADGAHLYLIQCVAGSCMTWVLHQSEANV